MIWLFFHHHHHHHCAFLSSIDPLPRLVPIHSIFRPHFSSPHCHSDRSHICACTLLSFRLAIGIAVKCITIGFFWSVYVCMCFKCALASESYFHCACEITIRIYRSTSSGWDVWNMMYETEEEENEEAKAAKREDRKTMRVMKKKIWINCCLTLNPFKMFEHKTRIYIGIGEWTIFWVLSLNRLNMKYFDKWLNIVSLRFCTSLTLTLHTQLTQSQSQTTSEIVQLSPAQYSQMNWILWRKTTTTTTKNGQKPVNCYC